VNWRGVRAIVRKDLIVVRRSRAIVIPLIIMPIIMLVVLPVVFSILPVLMSDPESMMELQRTLARLPAPLRASVEGSTPEQTWVMIVHNTLMAPLFLLVPFMVASIIAADSFAGERERKTLEALLNTPAPDSELFLAKVLAAWVPAMAATVLGFVLYAIVANAAGWPIMGRIFFPNLTWIVLVFWVAPAFAAVALAGMVLVSLRVRGTQEAMQLGGLLVLPLIALMVGQVRGVLLLGPTLIAITGAIVWLLAGILLSYGTRSFRRTKLIARL
jgi:ABC-type Na+ efflux pump permease subunit